ncbi:cationic amino acid transporter Ecym_2794 [Eremothecium cymbalariae DBVPG|uniref:Uncharacterized protein n=1 Tax=Eremothecium cymbalariae (strain CBS 270.75 / DBVPG 7215 / KCTC 17166 / NRRL Y-17582) TaxID=931890 RepID=G8JQ29_ERECY|nr:Hypothetical protein Ecym_2794 [Eremothecium cymbalariae DBVPG\
MRLPPIVLNSQTISGITGSISIACWVVVFVPQIYENFRRKSADGLSLLFVILWLAGDIFNLLGAVLQHLLPTMIVLATYYTLADIVLLVQCFVYEKKGDVDPVHLSPANPMNENVLQDVFNERQSLLTENGLPRSRQSIELSTREQITDLLKSPVPSITEVSKDKRIRKDILKVLLVLSVVLSGVLWWYISYAIHYGSPASRPNLSINLVGQAFGYLSAALYLSSRVPQVLLNFKRKSCEGISFLFFLFACLGNITYIISVLSISIKARYLLVNASWLIGSSGTLLLDFLIFVQFFVYRNSPIDGDSALMQSSA